ncbi:MAG TPA: hypothetical protein PKX48_05635 [Planctomycetota bacterium]|nr:hypothetical protein [Planctomycetota bacterium]OQC20228.1 MAG: hypothetical protein BWX69_02007 [Planctomycetes bacterium ADurb.Bin069]HNR99248.1 hypothetical protein [Planctomycetota bacterium]HNU27354.1 hypothetical protein [Planctomycetota bacterium]HOE30661.1 hypothetical protein [Planctomycetota bacterium]
MGVLLCAGLTLLRALAADGTPPPLEVFSTASRAEGAPFVARLVGKSETELRLEPAAGGDLICLPPAAVTNLKADKEPLREYLENYERLLGCRWVTLPGKQRPTVGFEEDGGGSGARAMVLDTAGRWARAAENGEPVRWGPALRGAEVELILGPPPVVARVDDGGEGLVVEAVCEVCRGKGNVDCPGCDTGQVRGPCPRCSGSGKERCTTCKGAKGTPCTFCRGTGTVRRYRMSGEQWFSPCERCGGRGRALCAGCGGKGEHTCLGCNGSGKVWVACPACKGARRLPCPACGKAPASQEAPARASEPAGSAIDYGRVAACAARREAGEARAGLQERRSAVADALVVFQDAADLYRRCMQSRERPGFRKALVSAGKGGYEEIQRGYLRGLALKTDLASFARWAERQSGLLAPEVVAAVQADVVFARARSVREALALGAGKAERLRDHGGDLRAALEREWSLFCARLDAEARVRAYAGEVGAAVGEIPNVKAARVLADEGVLEVRITAPQAAAANAALAAVAERVFPEFPELNQILAAGRNDLALSREEWDEARRARERSAAEAPEEENPQAAEEGGREPAAGGSLPPGKTKRSLLLLCGGIAASFALLAVVLRGRRFAERDADKE